MHVKKGDKVLVRTGKDKGRTGNILKIIKSTNRVVVSGVSIVKKHTKARGNTAGSIVEKESSIHSSNVALLDPKSGKPTRTNTKVVDGKRIRVASKSGQEV